MRVYLAGPMRGYDNLNYPAFDRAARKLRKKGHKIFSPAENDRKLYGKRVATDKKLQQSISLRKMFALDMDWICNRADAIAMLPGWEFSRGATAEHALALALGLEIIYL